MSKVEIIKRPIEQVSGNLKKSAWSAAIESLVIMIFGIFLVVWPDVTILVISNVLGAIFIVGGIYRVINYFVVKGQNDFFNNGLLSGIISLLIGLALLLMGEEIANVFRIVIGIWVIYESLVRISTSIKLHAAGIEAWKYTLILALMMLVLGVFITFNTGAILTLVGWVMILAGLIGIVGDIVFIQYISKITDIITGKTKAEK